MQVGWKLCVVDMGAILVSPGACVAREM